ncbi:MAG TPA: hypothetical protein VHG29_08650 [Novosphingobium sp.]|nr:hypothetical protein [Novosphingobium sp.]
MDKAFYITQARTFLERAKSASREEAQMHLKVCIELLEKHLQAVDAEVGGQ